MKRTIYISGKVTGTKFYKLKFKAIEVWLNHKGYIAYNPVKICSKMPKSTSYDNYMRVCLATLDCCESIYLMSGWSKSKGAVTEYKRARERTMLIYDYYSIRRKNAKIKT